LVKSLDHQNIVVYPCKIPQIEGDLSLLKIGNDMPGSHFVSYFWSGTLRCDHKKMNFAGTMGAVNHGGFDIGGFTGGRYKSQAIG
jgi:hypothetical protein